MELGSEKQECCRGGIHLFAAPFAVVFSDGMVMVESVLLGINQKIGNKIT